MASPARQHAPLQDRVLHADHSGMRALVPSLLVALAAIGCGPTGNTPTGASAGPATVVPVPAAATETAIRDHAATPAASRAVPNLVGTLLQELPTVLEGAGLRVQVVAFNDSDVVSAQYPQAGEAVPADGVLTVWVGAPPAPPPPASTPPAVEPAGSQAVVSKPAAPITASAAAVRPVPALPETSDPEPSPAPPGDTSEETPHPPRSNIRTMSPADPGTTLEGPASWYGDELAGSPTACGGVFDPAQLTMASRELRCGSRVRVTGPSGRSVEVTVTDWGPAEWTGHRFDLSEAAFGHIAASSSGVIPVTVEVLG